MSDKATDMCISLLDSGFTDEEISEFRGLSKGKRTSWPIWEEKLLKLIEREGDINFRMAISKGAWPKPIPGNRNRNRADREAFYRFIAKNGLIETDKGFAFPHSKAIHLFNIGLANIKGNKMDLTDHLEIRKAWTKEVKAHASALGWKAIPGNTNVWLLRRTP
jgi:hypothetical protein